jgi:hypothetical protein
MGLTAAGLFSFSNHDVCPTTRLKKVVSIFENKLVRLVFILKESMIQELKERVTVRFTFKSLSMQRVRNDLLLKNRTCILREFGL